MRKVGLLVLFLACAGITPAQAFDCAKATQQVERTICANAELKAADDAMGVAYKALKARLNAVEAAQLLQSQRVWLASREDCAAYADCLLARTQERTRILSLKAPGPADGMEIVPMLVSQPGSAKRWQISFSAFRVEPKVSEAFEEFILQSEAELPFDDLSDEEVLPDGRLYIHDETIEPTYLSERFLSVLGSLYVDGGGAHGNYGRMARHYDLEKDTQAVFADIFVADAAAKLVPECVAMIATEKKVRLEQEAEVDEAAVAASVAELTRWSFSPSGGKVMFDPYEVGSFAEGEYECAFAAAVLKPLLQADGPLTF
jgi:uncharacterized protein YecT (DUF1311 family)